MKRLIGVLVLVLGLGLVAFAAEPYDSLMGELGSSFQVMTSNISTTMKSHMGYYTGAGNIMAANTSAFPGIKIGLGLGLNLPLSALENITNLSSGVSPNADMFKAVNDAFNMAMFPYDQLVLKLGVPQLPFLPIPTMDIGVKIGYIPDFALEMPVPNIGNVGISVGMMSIGGEIRMLLFELPMGLLKVDARLSADYSSGHIGFTMNNSQTVSVNVSGTDYAGTNTAAIGFNYAWDGISIGAKGIAGINIPIIGSVYGGVGINMNFGTVTTTMAATNTMDFGGVSQITPLTVSNIGDYDPIDIRVLAGAQILFLNVAAEYGVLNGDLAATIMVVIGF